MKAFAATLLAVLALAGCKREERDFKLGTTAPDDRVRVSDLQPGQPAPSAGKKSEYEENAYAMSQGRTLYNAFNCVGCHAHGGGSMGPALMDDKWRYGSEPDQVFASIMQGRPNGMPSFRGKISEQQAWQLAAYVRSLSGQAAFTAAPPREDHMKANPPPSSVDPVKPHGEKSP
jgi:cytochrome c oxidase cbb3-type subunit 3